MIIVEDRRNGYRLVNVGNQGWYLYKPPISMPVSEKFIPADDGLVEIVLEKTGLHREQLFTRQFAEALMEHLVSRPVVRQKRKALASAL